MMRRYRIALGAAVGLALAAPHLARGDPADTLRVSLEESVNRALRTGEEARLAEADLATARARFLEARSTALPRLTLTTTYTRQVQSIYRTAEPSVQPFEPDTTAPLADRVRALEEALPSAGLSSLGSLFGSTPFGSENTWIATLGFTQKIFQGGSIWNSVLGARHAMRSAENRLSDDRGGIVLQVREAYLSALLTARGVRIAELGLQQAESQLERVRLRQQTGNASEFELLQAAVQRDNQVPAVRQAHVTQEVAELDLRRLANIPPAVPLALTTALLDTTSLPDGPTEPDTTGLIDAAQANAGIVAAREMAEARDHAVAVAGAERWPKFSLFANASQEAFPNDPIPHADDWRRDISAGLLVEWNLFDGFLTKGAIQEARAQRIIARQNLNQALESVRLQVLQNYGDLQLAAADLKARARTVEMARRAFELSNIRYQEGAADLLEVSDSRIAYQLAQMNEARARHDYFVALARLERLTGRPLFTEAAR